MTRIQSFVIGHKTLLLHKTGVVMVSPVRNPITQYKEVEGTRDQLRSSEIMAAEKRLVAKRHTDAPY